MTPKLQRIKVLVDRVEQLTPHIYLCGGQSRFVSEINPKAYTCSCARFSYLMEKRTERLYELVPDAYRHIVPQVFLPDEENEKLYCDHIKAVIEWRDLNDD